MKKIKIIFIILLFNTYSFSQDKALNLKVSFERASNYDFDLNQQTGNILKIHSSILINIISEGTGKVVFLSNDKTDNSKKNVYAINSCELAEYSNGNKYIKLKSNYPYGDFEIRIDIRQKRKRQSIIKIALINKANNSGVILFN